MKKPTKLAMNVLEDELSPEEFATVRVDEGSKHTKLKFVVNDESVLLIVPSSPSCHRWLLNWRAHFRRTYKAAKAP